MKNPIRGFDEARNERRWDMRSMGPKDLGNAQPIPLSPPLLPHLRCTPSTRSVTSRSALHQKESNPRDLSFSSHLLLIGNSIGPT